MRARCDVLVQRVTRLNVKYSVDHDQANWALADSSAVEPVYGDTMSYPSTYQSYTHWFQQPISARYWRLYPIQWDNLSSMKADIVGKVTP